MAFASINSMTDPGSSLELEDIQLLTHVDLQQEDDRLELQEDKMLNLLYSFQDFDPQTQPESSNIQSNQLTDQPLNSSDLRDILSEDRKKRKLRENWTEQRYQRLTEQFRNIYLGLHNKSLRKIASQMGFCTKTVQNKWNEYQYDQTLPSILNTLTVKHTRNRKRTLFYEQLIRQILAQNGLLTTIQIAKVVNHHMKKQPSQFYKHQLTANSVTRILKGANYAYKKIALIPANPTRKYTERVIIERRFQYCRLYKSLLESGAQLIFLDYTQISLYLKRKFCWILKDQHKPNAQILPKHKNSNIALLCVITRGGAAGWRLFEQPPSKQTFSASLKEIMKKFMQSKSRHNRKILFIESQAVYKNEVTGSVSAVNSASVDVCPFQISFLPPYSQAFNPNYCFFRELKGHIKTKNWTNKKELQAITKQILEVYKNFNFKPYFDRIQAYIHEGLIKIDSHS